MRGNTTTIEGNLTRDIELRYLKSGIAVATSGVARSWKTKNGDERAEFYDFDVWGDMAHNVAESLKKGDRVVVHGELKQSSWTTDDGTKRSKVSINADSVSPCLRWARAVIEKVVAAAPVQGELVEEPY